MSKWHTTEFCENCYKEFCCTSECKNHLLHRIEQAREEIENNKNTISMIDSAEFYNNGLDTALTILDRLISEVEIC